MKFKDIDWHSFSSVEQATLVFPVVGTSMLLIQKLRGVGAGLYNGAGGRCEEGEDPLACALREYIEELKTVPKDLTLRGLLDFVIVPDYQVRVHVFHSTGVTTEPQATEEAIPFWVNVDSLPYGAMWQDDRVWMPWFLEGRRFHGRFVMSDGYLEACEMGRM